LKISKSCHRFQVKEISKMIQSNLLITILGSEMKKLKLLKFNRDQALFMIDKRGKTIG